MAALALLLMVGGLATAHAEMPERPAPQGGILSLLPPPQTSTHSITINGRQLDYESRAATLSLLAGDGAVTAEIFYVAYSRKPSDDSPRPITFVFNGGPGAASAYLHLGALGPRIVATADDGNFLPPPQRMIDNPDSWLDMTDLVFVDPVGTGYSRAAPGHEEREFWGVQQDASSIAAFIRLYLAQSGRSGSPLYLAGESYGGFRAALLAKTLQEDAGLSPSGIVLISPALEFAFVYPDEFQPLHWALELPSMAATRLARDGISGDAFKAQLSETERYAMGDYLSALTGGLESGGRLASQRVAEITGLPLDLVRRHFARIPTGVFAKEFPSGDGKVVSPYDGTIATADIAPASARGNTPDPVLDRSVPGLTAAFVDYVRNELNYRTDISYRLLNREVSGNWDYGTSRSRQGYAGIMGDLQEARSLNPALDVLIVHGYTDLVTPYMASRYLVGQMPTLPDTKPIRLDLLDGGHMMYLRRDSRSALKQAASALYPDAAGPTGR